MDGWIDMRRVTDAFHDCVHTYKHPNLQNCANRQIIGKVLEINVIRTIHIEMGFPEIIKH
jgi:hypothetical protein